ncbi:zinc finger CCCH domain-containing protein 37 isoform X1 [Helianthus annuus]|uniref:Putative floral homeotic protein (HUA1) n=13 Tax=Helianthus TaxID=4231 RepID=A0A251TD99_HELAN|nr:zinc finger CCCH domain-containing protein 37 isoform X1 [Helianthus annuus]
MANQLYGSSSFGYGGASNPSNIFTSRPLADQYVPSDPSYLSSSRYLASDTISPSSNLFGYSSISDRGPSMMFNHKDTIGAGYPAAARATGAAALWPGPPGVDADANATALESFYAGYKRPASASEALYQSLLGAHNTIGQSEAWYSANPLAKRPRFQSSLPVYPQRPGEKDCAHYMLTRTCKFGDACKFDHPLWVPEGGISDWKEVPVGVTSEDLPERPEAPDCPYFLKTLTCKFGSKCKFNHPKDKIASLSASENNGVLELPERPSEPQCAFYMKTGKCKFGLTCKFHHPKDISIPVAEVGNGNGVQTEAATGVIAGNVTASVPPFTPAMVQNSKGLPIRPGEVDCPFYVKTGSCKYGATCRYNHPERYAMDPTSAIVGTPGIHMNLGLVNPALAAPQTVDPRLGHTMFGLAPTIYPQRPGQMECDHYMKTGECMFGERCRFHHPLDRTAHALSTKEGQQPKLTLAGLPRREGAVNCPYYMKTGACKYGATCKFDHPPPGEVMAAATSQAGEEVKDDVKENEATQE